MSREVLRYAAFTVAGKGGNRAGTCSMRAGCPMPRAGRGRRVGCSETAFVVPRDAELGAYYVRYFAPEPEVPFCGHATIATGVALAERGAPSDLTFHTPAGEVALRKS